MKYALLVGDGMADFPIPEFDGKTPLEYARTPHMDKVAQAGLVGLVKTIPDGLAPGSDVANMSLMGYDPSLYYSGRAPLEAASMRIKLDNSDVAFRCNLVTLQSGIMDDYSAGHIETDDAHEIINALQQGLGSDTIRFYPGISYRHLVVFNNLSPHNLQCTPPHDISGKEFCPYLPQGNGDTKVRELMEKAKAILAHCETNKRRIDARKKPVTDIWLWGQGKSISLPTLQERFSIKGSVISAVDLVRGLGVLAGLTVRIVPGATGYLGTNYAGKIKAAYSALSSGEDFVFVHVEAPDETSHEGSLSKKVQAIEEFDKHIVGEILLMQKEFSDLRILVLPDHATPVSTRTHDSSPVPYAMCGKSINKRNYFSYCEKSALGAKLFEGVSLFKSFIQDSM